jgi:hypothetical protein
VSDRVVAVVVRPSGLMAADLATAMLSDVVDLVADTPQVAPALAVAAGSEPWADLVAWPGTPRVGIDPDASMAQILTATSGLAGSAVAAVVADVPDLPPLLVGKLFSALAGPPPIGLAVCPAADGRLIAAATGTGGVPDWVARCEVGFDDLDALAQLRQAAPARALVVGPGWHRVREQADLDRLDPGLEGWDATRTYLTR